MVIALVVAVLGLPEWIEIRTGQPLGHDLTYVGYPEGREALWIGTSAGEVYRSSDGGVTWDWVFGPRSFDNLLDIRLRTLRVPTLNLDLLRSVGSNIPVRDREQASRRVLDLAGQARDRQRETSAQLLGILVAHDVRDPGDVLQVAHCFDYIYITARNGVWRGRNAEPWHFDLLGTGADLESFTWLSCDDRRMGHLAATTRRGAMMESDDFGETWHPYVTQLDRNSRVSFAIFVDGRIEILAQGRLYLEREDQRGFEPMCETSVDFVEPTMNWVWNTLGPIFGTGLGGVTVCESGVTKHYVGESMALAPIYYFQTQGNTDQHVMIVTADEILLSHDHGVTFETVFTRATPSAISLVYVDDLSTFADATVWAGNTVWKRINPVRSSSTVGVTVKELERQTPLAEVIEIGLRAFELDGSQVAARRDDARLQGFLPLLRASYARDDGQDAGLTRGLVDAISARTTRRDSRDFRDRDVWTVIALWDIADLLRSRSSTDRGWADVHRLHAVVCNRIQDAYGRWMSINIALAGEQLGPAQRAHLEIARREAAAYLDYMTAGAFAAFH